MNNKYFYFLGIYILLLFLVAELFLFSTDLEINDMLHRQNFNMNYGIFCIVQPLNLNFSVEKILSDTNVLVFKEYPINFNN